MFALEAFVLMSIARDPIGPKIHVRWLVSAGYGVVFRNPDSIAIRNRSGLHCLSIAKLFRATVIAIAQAFSVSPSEVLSNMRTRS
jgi:hypothetical protein